MPKRKRHERRTEQNNEDVQRISDIVNRRKKKDKKNPFLRSDGGFHLIDRFPVYKEKRLNKAGKQIKGGHE